MLDASTILSEAPRAGVVIRLRGEDLRVIGLNDPSLENAAQWRERVRSAKPEIIAALGGNDDPAGETLDKLGVHAMLVTDADRARGEVAELVACGSMIGLDIETMPSAEEAAAAEALTADLARATCARRGSPGGVAASAVSRLRAELAKAERAPLYPGRGKIRLVQAYVGGKTAVVFDLNAIDLGILAPVWKLPLVIHNAAFELKFLQEAGIELERFACTLQMAGLAAGVECRSLDDASREFLNINLTKKKELQLSDWSAPNLSQPQVNYAALDAVLAFRLAKVLRPLLAGDRVLDAYRIQRDVLPAVARMARRGVGFDNIAHAALLEDLKERRLELEERFEASCIEAGKPDLASGGVPLTPAGKAKLLAALLTPDEFEAWPVTPKGLAKSTKRADLRRGAHHAPIAVLAEFGIVGKQLTSFGPTLSVFARNGRIHASYNVAAANTGRASCSNPNVQQTPSKGDGKRFRSLYVAAPGHTLVGGDWSSMELRAAAYISGDVTMTKAFAEGADLHRLTAASFAGIAPDAVSDAERTAAKAINFGALYGMGAGGLVQTAWNNYGMRVELQEAEDRLAAFDKTYPQLAEWKRRNANICKSRGYVRISAEASTDEGRIHRFSWNAAPKPGERDKREFSYTQSCNLPVQGSCADASMLALTMIDKALSDHGIAGGPVIWCHDEIVLEVPEEAAGKAAELLEEAMTLAFVTIFPSAPINGLVAARQGRSWLDTK